MAMIRLCHAIAIACALAAPTAAAPTAAAPTAAAPTAAAQEKTAMPPSLDASALDTLRSAMHRLVDDKLRAGLVYGIVYRGKIVTIDAYGYRDLEHKLPMTADTIFRIFSMSRAVTSAAILTLVDDGTIGLDDPVAKYLPEFAATPVIRSVQGDEILTEPQSMKLSVRHLFTYTAGLGYAFDWPKSLGFTMGDVLRLDEPTRVGIRALATMPLLTQPGAKWHYGFSGDVLGAVAEVAANEPLDRFLAERLTGKLGMKDTGFWLEPGQVGRLSRAYGPAGGQPLADITSAWQKEYGTFDKPIKFLSAGGGLASTVPDYLRLLLMLLNGGELDGVRVLKPETVRMMLSRQTTPEQGLTYWYDPSASPLFKDRAWGLGISVPAAEITPKSAPDGQMDGWAGLMNTVFFVDPGHDLAAVAMSQYLGPDADALGQTLHRGLYAALTHDGRD
jgi:CubicO group peptidase (beta-lactamase class C family)